MASRGRDLELNIISKAAQFDLEKPAAELDALGEKADGSAKKIDDAFDRISSSTKSSMRKVDDDLGRGKRGLDDFKNEANQTARESAASFSGSFEDVADTIQETAANAFAGFGPLGAAAGLAAAAGLGTLLTKFNEAKEKAAELRKEFTGLLIEGNGKITAGSLFDRIKDMAQEGTLGEVAQQAKDAAINTRDWVRAMAGDQDALQRVNKELTARIALLEQDDTANFQQIDRLKARKAQTEELLTVLGYAAEAEGVFAAATDAAAKAQEDAAKGAELTATRYDAVTEAVRQVGDATDELATLAEENGQLTAKAIVATLAAQTKAAGQFRDDLLEVQKRGDTEFLTWVSQQPAEVAAAYADGTEKEKASIYAAFKANVGVQMSLAIAKGIAEGRPSVAREAAITRAAAEAAATGQPIKLSIDVTRGFTNADIWAIRSEAQRQLSAAGALRVPVMLGAVQPGNPFVTRKTP